MLLNLKLNQYEFTRTQAKIAIWTNNSSWKTWYWESKHFEKTRNIILDFKKANSCVLRVAGFKKIIEAHNKKAEGKIEVVSEIDGNGDRTKGYQSTADALQAHEDLNAIFAINDPSAHGAYTAVKEAKRENKIKIIGFDGQLDGKQAIKDGKIYADPIQHPDKMGKQIVQLIVKYQAGESFDPETLIPATLYTKAEADQDPELK